MSGSQGRYLETARRMDEALVSLLGEKDLEFVTIKELCARAGVSRSTFLLHYGDIGDLLDECARDAVDRFLSYFATIRQDVTERMAEGTPEELVMTTPEVLALYLTFVRDNLPIFRAAIERPGPMDTEGNFQRLFDHVIDPILARFSIPERDRRYYALFHLSGITAVVREWVGHGCADDIGHVAEVISSCVLPQALTRRASAPCVAPSRPSSLAGGASRE